MARDKFSSDELTEFYRRIHRNSLETNPHDNLTPVTCPSEPRWVNYFVDFAHRLGMKRAFAFLSSNLGSFSGRCVLDLGCGRGRWTREYVSRGCRVTGVDISLEAVNLLAREMPEHCFLCQDITSLIVPNETFDIVNSVTVLQHMPEELQREAMKRATGALRKGGYLVLLENTADFEACIVFPHRPKEWIGMAEECGLQLCGSWGSNYEVLFRALPRAVRRLIGRESRNGNVSGLDACKQGQPSMRRLKSARRTLMALGSFPLEWFLSKVPMVEPSHQVMIFRK